MFSEDDNIETTQRVVSRLETPITRWIARRGYLAQDLTIEHLSAKIGTNRSYLSTYINTKYHMSFRNWVASLRLEYAKEIMVTNSKISITEVAEIIGYSQSSFSTIFKKHYGEPISKWRNCATSSGSVRAAILNRGGGGDSMNRPNVLDPKK